ncbi:hypothetical protein IG631_13799 [Alternaria alternata]|nr:hypothetical protein IG631_13799 [Alternaria alternata]
MAKALDYSSRPDPCAARIVESGIVRLSSLAKLPFHLGIPDRTTQQARYRMP